MKQLKYLLSIFAITCFTGSALAQVVGMGTTSRGGTLQIATAVAKVVSATSDIRMRTQPMAGTAKYIPEVNAGNLEFAVANVVHLGFAKKGIELAKGHPNPNLVLVGTLMKFRIGLIVPISSGINSIGDLKGRLVPSGVKSSPSAMQSFKALLGNAGLTFNDVKRVPTTSLVTMWNGFEAGKFITTVASVGSGRVTQMASKVGGVRFLPIDPSPAAYAGSARFLPGSEPTLITPAKGLTGIDKPTYVIGYDYAVFASNRTDDGQAYKVAKAMYYNQQELRESAPLWRTFDKNNLGKKHKGLTYHPGAIKFYKEKGIW
jgi:TRAP transporter TAXI family solute receptor